MANRIKTGDPHGFNKGHSSKFYEGSRVQETPGGWRTSQPKCCGNNNKDEDNSLKTLNDKNQLYDIKYSYLIHVICTQLYGFQISLLYGFK